MSNELAIPNIGETIRDKVRQVIFDSIPEEKIESMIKAEFESFFHKKKRGDYYNAPYDDSQFEVIVKDEIKKHMRAKLEKDVQTQVENWMQVEWKDGGREIVNHAAEEVGRAFFKGFSRDLAQRILNSISNL